MKKCVSCNGMGRCIDSSTKCVIVCTVCHGMGKIKEGK